MRAYDYRITIEIHLIVTGTRTRKALFRQFIRNFSRMPRPENITRPTWVDKIAAPHERPAGTNVLAGLPRPPVGGSADQWDVRLNGTGRHRRYRLPLSSAEARRTSERNSDL
jgi:hypothetical protein